MPDTPAAFCWQGDTLVLRLRVQPRASRTAWGELRDRHIKLYLTAPPVDGKANAALAAFLGKEFGVAKSRVELLRGESGREKVVAIHAPPKIPSVIQEIIGTSS